MTTRIFILAASLLLTACASPAPTAESDAALFSAADGPATDPPTLEELAAYINARCDGYLFAQPPDPAPDGFAECNYDAVLLWATMLREGYSCKTAQDAYFVAYQECFR